jgi:hypothetical protein
MGLPGRPSLARVLLLSVVLSGLALGPGAAPAGAVDSRRTLPPGSATLPVRGPRAAGAGSFVPGRVLVGFEAGAGERGRRRARPPRPGPALRRRARVPGSGLEFTAPVRGTYLLDVYSTGATGDDRFTWTVQNAAGLPIEVTAPACSPNGDGVQDSCTWTAGAIAGWTITSFVTRGAARVARLSGPGEQAWDGRGSGRRRLPAPGPVRRAGQRPGPGERRPEGRPPAARLDRPDRDRGLAARPLQLRDRGQRRRRQHRPVGTPHRACAVKHNSDNRLTGLPGSARVGRHLAEGPSSAGRVPRDRCRPRRYPL